MAYVWVDGMRPAHIVHASCFIVRSGVYVVTHQKLLLGHGCFIGGHKAERHIVRPECCSYTSGRQVDPTVLLYKALQKLLHSGGAMKCGVGYSLVTHAHVSIIYT